MGILASPEFEKLFGSQPCDLSAVCSLEARQSMMNTVDCLLKAETVIDCQIRVICVEGMDRPLFAICDPKFQQ